MITLRALAGVLAGYIVMALIIILGTMAATAALTPDGRSVTDAYLIANLAISLAAAIAGGYAAARVARDRPVPAAAVLAAIVLIGGFLMEGGSGRPGWYPLLIPLIGAAGVALGSYLAIRSRAEGETLTAP